MRKNFTGGASTSGGTSTLALSAAGGLALPALSLAAGQMVQYSIVQYTDSTLQAVAKSESGFGKFDGSNVLTRSDVRTTWDGSTTYTESGTTALSFGTSNVMVYVSELAEGGGVAIPRVMDTSGDSGGTYQGLIPLNMLDAGSDYATSSLSANTAYFSPVWLSAGFCVSKLGISISTAASGKVAAMCIASMSPTDGGPDVNLMGLSGLDLSATGPVFGSVDTPRILASGWYWFCIVANAAVSIRGSNNLIPGPFGGLVSVTRLYRYMYRGMPYGAFGNDVRSAFPGGGSWNPVNNNPAQVPILRQ